MHARATAERALNRAGMTVVGSRNGSGISLHPIGLLTSQYGWLRHNLTQPFEVELDRVTTCAGFSYHPSGWHPYLATLDELLDDPDIPYEQTVLAHFYRAFQPTSVAEALAVAPSRSSIDQWPPVVQLLTHIWAATPKTVARATTRSDATGSRRQEIGPQSEDFGRRQRERIRAVHESILRDGFEPDVYRDGRLSGYFLVRGDDHRFVVTHGNHRLPTLRRIGLDRIPVRFDHETPPVVNAAQLDRWSAPSRALTGSAATAVFTALFDGTGRDRATLLGLA